jgi:hypothetical protein
VNSPSASFTLHPIHIVTAEWRIFRAPLPKIVAEFLEPFGLGQSVRERQQENDEAADRADLFHGGSL